MSNSGKFDKEDVIKILKGAGIAGAGAILTYLADTVPGIDFGQWTPIVVAGTSILVNMARKWLTNTGWKI